MNETQKTESDTQETPVDNATPEQKKAPVLTFLLLVGIAGVAAYFVMQNAPTLPFDEGGEIEEMEEVSEELLAIRMGEGAVSETDFVEVSCDGTYTHTPLGFSFSCPEGWWHPFESSAPDVNAPLEHYVYQTAFTSTQIETPLDLPDGGSWIAIDAGTRVSACDAFFVESDAERTPVMIDGEESFYEEASLTDMMGEVLFSGVRSAVEHNGVCYQFSMLHPGGEPLSDAQMEILTGLFESFQFNR